jgi:type I restriction enzyme S subunit
MGSNYKRLGDYIQEVNIRNKALIEAPLMGVSIKKVLMPSIANIIGTDMSTYKLIQKNQFAYGSVTSRNGDKISIALMEEHDQGMVSQAYTVFEVKDVKELAPEYLMMWFRRPEFDRYARFMSHGSAREIFSWTEMRDTLLPIPSPEKQLEIVKEYNAIQNRIQLNNQLITKLEETAQAIYKQWFESFDEDKLSNSNLGELCSLITDGKHGDCQDELDSGYYFVSVKDLSNGEIIYNKARQITKEDFEETHRRTNLCYGDILITNAGTIGKMAIVKDLPQTTKTTFQKSVAILKPKNGISKSYYLYLLVKYHLKDIIDLAGGSTQSNLLLGDLRNFEIEYPGYEFVLDLELQITPVFEMMGLKGLENQNLIKLRDLILSKMTTIEK